MKKIQLFIIFRLSSQNLVSYPEDIACWYTKQAFQYHRCKPKSKFESKHCCNLYRNVSKLTAFLLHLQNNISASLFSNTSAFFLHFQCCVQYTWDWRWIIYSPYYITKQSWMLFKFPSLQKCDQGRHIRIRLTRVRS